MVDARKRAGWSQEKLAERSGVNLGVISRAERMERIPGLASILDLAHALKLDVPALLGDAMRDAADGSGVASDGDSE
jgi:transcriptional regulator with XRE-family HTH domain